MTAYAFKDGKDVLVVGERSGADQSQEDGGTMPVTFAGAGIGDVGAEGVDRQGAAGFPQERVELPVQNKLSLEAATQKLITKTRSRRMFRV